MLGRAKSCQWQVFVRRRPPKQGELRTDVSKATMFQGDEAAAKMHAERAALNGANFPKGKFQKDLILLVESCYLGRLIQGSQNLELPERETDCHFLRRAKSNQKARGTPSCDLESNLRSIQDFGGNNRPSSSNRPRRVLQGFWVSPVRI